MCAGSGDARFNFPYQFRLSLCTVSLICQKLSGGRAKSSFIAVVAPTYGVTSDLKSEIEGIQCHATATETLIDHKYLQAERRSIYCPLH